MLSYCLLLALAGTALGVYVPVHYVAPTYHVGHVYSRVVAPAAVAAVHHTPVVTKVTNVGTYHAVPAVPATTVSKVSTYVPSVAAVHAVPAAVTTVKHVPTYGYGFGYGVGYPLGTYAYGLGYGLAPYGLNYGYGLSAIDYATLLKKKLVFLTMTLEGFRATVIFPQVVPQVIPQGFPQGFPQVFPQVVPHVPPVLVHQLVKTNVVPTVSVNDTTSDPPLPKNGDLPPAEPSPASPDEAGNCTAEVDDKKGVPPTVPRTVSARATPFPALRTRRENRALRSGLRLRLRTLFQLSTPPSSWPSPPVPPQDSYLCEATKPCPRTPGFTLHRRLTLRPPAPALATTVHHTPAVSKATRVTSYRTQPAVPHTVAKVSTYTPAVHTVHASVPSTVSGVVHGVPAYGYGYYPSRYTYSHPYGYHPLGYGYTHGLMPYGLNYGYGLNGVSYVTPIKKCTYERSYYHLKF
ncbi:hypothetical protein MTO96_019716 [Rhipicephalus appendiculatus]